MRFADFLLRADLIGEFRAEEKKNQLIAAAYTAWLMGSGGKCSFKSYQISLGLIEKPPPLTKEEKKEMAQKGYSTAARIIQLDKKRSERAK